MGDSQNGELSDSKSVRFLCRHLVALCISYRAQSDSVSVGQAMFLACPGTVIKIGDLYAFLTAGHALQGIYRSLRKKEVVLERAVLADTFGIGSVSDQPIPFDLASEPCCFIDDEGEGLDFGVVALRPFYTRLLAANGIVAVSEENWSQQHSVRFDTHLMLGLPIEFTSRRLNASGAAAVTPTIIRVMRLEKAPSGTRQTRYPRFVGRIDAELPLKSIKGMSGGPIFGFNYGPRMRYWIVALQSSWLPDRRLTFGCPLPVIGQLLSSWISRLGNEYEFPSGGHTSDGSSNA